jgi:hypothetical protein
MTVAQTPKWLATARPLIRTSVGGYRRLSSRTAQARRDGEFPSLVDNTRTIHRPAIDGFWDEYRYQSVLDQEAEERDELAELADEWRRR